ncbi:hypothetical protein WA026_011641 [Henosepilachna vigintioctopunctata]|uniref:Uncharacterized protein n=1 Tax=Henosepilachna vigintioctopunctata TaxID=420089 RepID=A0AAW1TTA2_9CUCU
MSDLGIGRSKRDDSKLGFGVPSLSWGNSRETLEKATNTLRNTGEKVENFLFSHQSSRSETHTESSGGGFGLGGKGGLSLGFDAPSLGTPNHPKVSKLPKSNHGFGLPSLSNLGTHAKNDLEKAGSAIENTGKKAIDFLFGGRPKTPSLPGLGIDVENPSVPPNGISLNGNLGRFKANDTSLGVSLGKGKSSIGASLTLPNLTGVGSKMKNDLGKVEDALENTGKKAIDFLFGRGKADSSPGIDLNAPSIPSLGITLGSGNLGLPNLPKGNLTMKHNLENGTSAPGLSLDIQKGNLDASLPSFGVKINGTSTGNLGSINANGPSLGISLGNKASIGASLSLPNLSAPTNNLNKVGDAIENTGKKATNFLPSLSSSSTDTTTSNKQKGTVNIPVDSTLGGNVYGSIGLPGLPLGEESTTPGGSDEKSIGLPEVNFPKLGGPVLVDLGSTKAENTYTNIPLSGLPNSTVGLNEGELPGTSPESLSTTDQPFTATLNPLFEGLDKILYANNISITGDGTPSFSSTNEDEIAEADFEEYGISTYMYDEATTSTKDTSKFSAEADFGEYGSSSYNYDKVTTSTEDTSNFSESSGPISTSTETHSIFNGNGNGISIPYNITTESEKDLKKIEEILRGKFDANSPTSWSNGAATRKKENNVTSKTQTRTPTTESIKPVQSTTLEYPSTQTSTTERPRKTKPAVIPPYFLVPNSNVTFGEDSEPVLPPSVFDNPTGEKAPFIPILPSSPNTHMGPYNLTDRGGVNSNPSGASTPDNLSAVTYGAIGVGAIAIISIIIAFIYKAIKKARRSSSGGSYSPKSNHKEQDETRRSSSNSEGNEGNSAVVDSQVQQTIITHAVINETTAEAKKIIRNGKSRAPDPQRKQNEIPDENTDQGDLDQPGPSNTEVLNFEKTYDPEKQSEKFQQQESTTKNCPTGMKL